MERYGSTPRFMAAAQWVVRTERSASDITSTPHLVSRTRKLPRGDERGSAPLRRRVFPWDTGGMYTVELYARIRPAVHVEERSQREVAREFGLARKTVRKMLEYPAPSGRRWTGSRAQRACRSPLHPNFFRRSDNNSCTCFRSGSSHPRHSSNGIQPRSQRSSFTIWPPLW